MYSRYRDTINFVDCMSVWSLVAKNPRNSPKALYSQDNTSVVTESVIRRYHRLSLQNLSVRCSTKATEYRWNFMIPKSATTPFLVFSMIYYTNRSLLFKTCSFYFKEAEKRSRQESNRKLQSQLQCNFASPKTRCVVMRIWTQLRRQKSRWSPVARRLFACRTPSAARVRQSRASPESTRRSTHVIIEEKKNVLGQILKTWLRCATDFRKTLSEFQ